MSEAQTCTGCGTPFFPGTDYCTDCGGQLSWQPQGQGKPADGASLEASFGLSRSGPPTAIPASIGSQVVVTDIRMGFGSMVVFMIKWALASIPAGLILIAFSLVASTFLTGMLGGFLRMLG